jgi:hypothetical protein
MGQNRKTAQMVPGQPEKKLWTIAMDSDIDVLARSISPMYGTD